MTVTQLSSSAPSGSKKPILPTDPRAPGEGAHAVPLKHFELAVSAARTEQPWVLAVDLVTLCLFADQTHGELTMP